MSGSARRIVPPGRVVGLDVARCLALLGMVATHTLPATGPDGEVTLAHAVAAGRSAALFAVLAGASVALMSGGRRPRADAPVLRRLVVRAGLVGLVGLVLGQLDTGVAVILTYYAVLFAAGLPFLRLRAGTLAGLAAAGVLVLPVVSHLVRPALPARGYGSPSFAQLTDPGRLLAELTVTGYYPVLTWLPYLLAGMALGRLDLTRRAVAAAVAAVGAGVALAATVASSALVGLAGGYAALARSFPEPVSPDQLERTLARGLYGTTPTGDWWWLAVDAPHAGTPPDLAHTLGTGLAVVGVSLLLAPLAPRLLAVLFGAGAMTLTLYTLHVVLRVPEAWPGDGAATFARHAGLLLAVGAAYRLAGRSGPLERLLAVAGGRPGGQTSGPDSDACSTEVKKPSPSTPGP